MELVVDIAESLNLEQVGAFLKGLRISCLCEDWVPVPANPKPIHGINTPSFNIDVRPGGKLFEEDETQEHLDNKPSTLLLFNPEVAELEEPKVIYMTDHSHRASANLDAFKQLKPRGFYGATVISECETIRENSTWNDLSTQILEKIRSAVQTTRANLIIANYDLGRPGQKFDRMACLSKLVNQNACHVLILKS